MGEDAEPDTTPLPQMAVRSATSRLWDELLRRGITVEERDVQGRLTASRADRSVRVVIAAGSPTAFWHWADESWKPGERICWTGVAARAADRIVARLEES